MFNFACIILHIVYFNHRPNNTPVLNTHPALLKQTPHTMRPVFGMRPVPWGPEEGDPLRHSCGISRFSAQSNRITRSG